MTCERSKANAGNIGRCSRTCERTRRTIQHFDVKPKDMFDPEYMQKLLEIGYRRAKSGTAWKTEPPGYKVK